MTPLYRQYLPRCAQRVDVADEEGCPAKVGIDADELEHARCVDGGPDVCQRGAEVKYALLARG